MSNQQQMSFLQHLDELRWRLVRIAIAVLLVGVVIWVYQEWIMNHLFLALKDHDFITFRLLCTYFGICVSDTTVKMQSMTVSGQFNYAMMMSIMGGLIVSSPFIFYQLWAFVKPGLKKNEISATKGMVFYISLCFLTGVLFGYFVVAPLTVQFFGSFQISQEIENNFTVGSYVGTVISTVFYSGLLFLLPIKKDMLLLFLPVILATPNNTKKYRITNIKRVVALIVDDLSF